MRGRMDGGKPRIPFQVRTIRGSTFNTIGPAVPEFEIEVGKRLLRANHYHDLGGILEVFVLDVYCLRTIPCNALVLDLGAGIGDFSLAASNRLRGGGLILALEPNPTDFQLLRTNLQLNHVRNVIPEECALGREPGLVSLSFKGTSFVARSVPLDDILKSAGSFYSRRSLSHPIFVKMD
ncbi:methyltransferase FkbM family, partial [mine drainage metagenome]